MPHLSILARIAPLLTTQIENVATDALAHLLLQYEPLADAFRRFISATDVGLPDGLTIKTQAGGWEDSGIPDLVGLDAKGRYRLIVESKFWASLTDNQPATYIERLPTDEPSILLFIAPASRLPTLWPQLQIRCSSYGIQAPGPASSDQAIRFHGLNHRRVLAITSWETLLTLFSEKARQVGNLSASADVWQLQSLCERINGEVFNPPPPDDLTAPTEKRINQFRELVDELVARLVDSRVASVAGYKATPGADYYVRYMSLQDIHNWGVIYSESYRRKYPPSLLFLQADAPLLPEPFTSSATGTYKVGTTLLFPLDVPVGVERAAVLESLLSQIRDVARRLRGG